jgi:hypothetical protein
MAEFQIALTTEERDYLVKHLETVLKETQVEEHRTRTPAYRAHVLHEEGVITALLTKLQQAHPTS